MSITIPPQLERVTRALWPAPARTTLGRGRSTGSSERYLVLPSPTRPRLLVPDGNGAIAASAVANSSVGSGRMGRIARVVAAAALRAGLGRALPIPRLMVEHPPDTPGLLDWLADESSLAAHSMAVRLGSERANQKPVLQLMDDAGRVIGYAKVGSNPLTRALVAAEHDALVQIAAADLVAVKPPRVLAFGPWGDSEVLVLTPLAIPTMPSSAGDLLVPAMREIACTGPGGSHPVSTGPYGAGLYQRLASLDDPAGPPLRARVDDLFARHGTRSLRLGGWHGDFRPWNVAPLRSRLLVWDWERHATEVPVGFDAVHYHHPLVDPGASTTDWQARIADATPKVRALLAAMDVDDADLPLLTTLHVVELLVRHLEDVTRHQAIRRDGDVEARLQLIDHRLAAEHGVRR